MLGPFARYALLCAEPVVMVDPSDYSGNPLLQPVMMVALAVVQVVDPGCLPHLFLLFAQLLLLNNVKVSREARKQKEANLISFSVIS